ncbi:HAMP domain-containing histidine kinase [Alicyclobacillus mengziensis]|uniref:histidine kinase n=2 Tax=Alicyclobacillus mengziensis TaxID=2931921 RepID=A0A9X7W3Z4_9BACL|nr:HAMP domain-containing histidine kinase [Alicyclobacillus mengziensis]
MGRWIGQITRFFRPRSLRLQLLSRSLVILSGLLVLIGIFQYIIMSHFLYQNTATNIRNQIRSAPPHAWDQLLGSVQPGNPARPGQGQTPQVQSSDGQGTSPGSSMPPQGNRGPGNGRGPGAGQAGDPFFTFDISSIAFVDTGGTFTTMHGTAPRLAENDYQAALTTRLGSGSYIIARDSTGKNQLLVLQPVSTFGGGTIGVLQIGTSVSALQRVLVQQLLIFVFLALIALIIGLFTFLPILRRTLVPLSRMVDTVSRINAGNLNERIAASHEQLEIELLSSSFNDMLDRLEVSFEAEREAKEKMRQFVADASHELRTPLTSIHGFLEVLLRGAATKPYQLEKALRSMHGESERIIKLVSDLLLLAQLDKQPNMALTKDRLDVVITEMQPQLRILAADRHVDFSLATAVEVKFDKDKIKQVVLNLFQNAVQHTDPLSGKITVQLAQDETYIRLMVSDNGPGIPLAEQAKVFERFYRLDASRSRSHGGAGLGLAITKSIVEGHNGTIACTSGPTGGAKFIVLLPRAQGGN